MATVNFQTALKKFPKEQQAAVLETIKAVETLFPRATRAIAWNMPTLKIGDDNLCHIMAFKNHNSLFPASGSVAEHVTFYSKIFEALSKTILSFSLL